VNGRVLLSFVIIQIFTSSFTARSADLIAAYDDSVPPAPPPPGFGPNFILPAAGNAFFRSGWGEGDA
jgi:hypothetical protein